MPDHADSRYRLDNGEVVDASANGGHGGSIGLVFAKSTRHGTTYTASVTDGDGWTVEAEDGLATSEDAVAWVIARQPCTEVVPASPVVVTPAGLQRLLHGFPVPSQPVSEEVDQMRMF